MNGYTQKGLLNTYVHYDAHGNKTGYSQTGFAGQIFHYDNNGEKTGCSDPAFLVVMFIMIKMELKQDEVTLHQVVDFFTMISTVIKLVTVFPHH